MQFHVALMPTHNLKYKRDFYPDSEKKCSFAAELMHRNGVECIDLFPLDFRSQIFKKPAYRLAE